MLNTSPLSLVYTPRPVSLSVNGQVLTPSVRLRREMAPVAMGPLSMGACEEGTPVYFMYRGVARPQDAPLFEGWRVRFDVTVIPPTRLGPEFAKTAGHYHPIAENGVTYPELYEVLLGEAHFLLQRPEDEVIADVILVQAEAGEKLLVPPNYGHVTINPGSENLVMANLVSSSFESIYELYRARHGAAYYELTDGRLTMNTRYGRVPTPRRARARDQGNRLPEANIYALFLEEPARMGFLNRPSMLSSMDLAFGKPPASATP